MDYMKKVYVVMEFPNEGMDEQEDLSMLMPFIIGVFGKKSLASAIAKEMTEKQGDKYSYFIEEYDLNNVYFKTQEEVDREVSECIEEMVKEGLIDYKIGDDGQFYFEVTDKGKKEIE